MSKKCKHSKHSRVQDSRTLLFTFKPDSKWKGKKNTHLILFSVIDQYLGYIGVIGH